MSMHTIQQFLLAIVTAWVFAEDVPMTPVDAGMKWYRGNTHTHSLWSDGDALPEAVADRYRKLGYAFLVLTEHNAIAQGDRWIGADSHQAALDDAARRFGPAWNVVRDSNGRREVRLRRGDEVGGALNAPGRFLLLPGEEVTDGATHLTVIGIPDLIRPPGGPRPEDRLSATVKAVQGMTRAGHDLEVFINHPNFRWELTAEDLLTARDVRFLEIGNAHPVVNNDGDVHHPPVERLWDVVNTIRLARDGLPPMYGVASDDAHEYLSGHGAMPGQAWIMVRAEHLTSAAILSAIRRGDFYASTGVILSRLEFDGANGVLSVEVDQDQPGDCTISFVGSCSGVELEGRDLAAVDHDGKPLRVSRRYDQGMGRILGSHRGKSASYRMKGDEVYVRAVIETTRPPLSSGHRQRAWTQPVGWDRWVKRTPAPPGPGAP